MSVHNGSCFCGEINFKLNAALLNAVNCHCNVCRAHAGAAFASYAVLPYGALEITRGQEKLGSFAIRDGRKHFCGTCGTPLFNVNNTRYPGLCMIYLGTLAQAREITPKINIWCESKLPWVDAVSAIPSREHGVERKPA